MPVDIPIKKLILQGKGIRYPGPIETVEKVAILPFKRSATGEVKFLFAAPLPKFEKSKELPFGIARGTIQLTIERNGQPELVDLGREDVGEHKVIGREKLHDTALREGEEELGLDPKSVAALYYCGPLAFKQKGIHTYLAQVKENFPLLMPALDSCDVRWLSANEAQDMALKGEFNGSYLPMVKTLDGVIKDQIMSAKTPGR